MRRLLGLTLLCLALVGPGTPTHAQTSPTPDSRVRGGIVTHSRKFRVDGSGAQTWNGIQAVDNIRSFGADPAASAATNATAIQAAINDAQTNNRILYIPAAPTGCYNYTPPLTISNDLTIQGDFLQGNWQATNVDIPIGNPPLIGSVLCPTPISNTDAIDFTGAATQVNITNLGINFGTAYTATGDGLHFVTASSGVGPMTSTWQNVQVYGTDNNHYAFNIANSQYIDLIADRAFGGGALKLVGNNASFNTGNVEILDAYFDMFLGNGTANCIDISGTSAQKMNLISTQRMQCNVENIAGVTPAGQVPTSSNFIYHQDANSQYVTNVGLDIETSVNAPALLGAGTGNDYSLNTMFYDGGSGVLQLQPWGANGILDAVPSQTFQDVGSSGTIAEKSFMHLQAHHFSSTSATTASIMTTLWVDAPIAGTNLTPTRTEAAVFNGEVYAKGADFTSDAGIFNNAGNVQLGSVYATCSGYLTTTNGSGLVGCIVANTVSSVSGTGLGTTPSVTSTADGRDMVMDITVGTTPSAANFTITFGTAAAHGWRCDGDDITTNSTSVSQLKQFGTGSTTTCTMEMFSDVAVAAAMTAADHLRVRASPY